MSGLGKGVDDDSIARYSLDEERVVVTYDDDFVLEIDEDDYRAVLYVGEAALPVEQVADIVHAVSRHYPPEEVHGLTYVGENWL